MKFVRALRGNRVQKMNETSELDLVWGLAAIGKEIDRNRRQTVNLLENHQLPAAKVGRLWVSSRAKLRAHFAQLLQAEATAETEAAP
jgi:hypothetical protein